MNVAVIQLLVLAGVAIFLILRLRSVLGTREGFEKPQAPVPEASRSRDNGRHEFEVIEGGVDRDIADHVEEGPTADALARMKSVEPGFSVGEFLQGARGAYEMILMAFERGDLVSVEPFLGEDVMDSFNEVVKMRAENGVTVDASFIGVREVKLTEASFDEANSEAEITVRFIGELTSVVRDAGGDIVEGDPNAVKRQRDIWTFARQMGTGDPNWKLVATGE
ncbi:Tim44/TimA family putative adaptor protein [Vannielia litorea]|uniref:Tim44/TimA family putative adaptor protein n=1 Tax=Vannielia litorea TaxID=1217970 RepID=UPI001C9893FD|nr:Tim44/TimA family putative adaptor protein [Vannielia litorea]MBY6049312.1 Tim44/TimA family putative adaptor protein [Vannielia litorea]MBY6076726.1 Tim44/TimA family putative adaptor protein [Vannielia litorea]